jgi:hypothetical protein
MARPHNKVLLGKEEGNPSQHWYNFVETKRAILRSKRWDGGCPQSRPGISYMTAENLLEKEAKKNAI